MILLSTEGIRLWQAGSSLQAQCFPLEDPAPGFWFQIPALLPSTKLYLASGVLLLGECSSGACFEKLAVLWDW